MRRLRKKNSRTQHSRTTIIECFTVWSSSAPERASSRVKATCVFQVLPLPSRAARGRDPSAGPSRIQVHPEECRRTSAQTWRQGLSGGESWCGRQFRHGTADDASRRRGQGEIEPAPRVRSVSPVSPCSMLRTTRSAVRLLAGLL